MDWDDVSRLALALPGAHESDHFGASAFRVGKTLFASQSRTEPALLVKLDPEDQGNLALAHAGLIERVTGPGREAKAGIAGWTVVRYQRCKESLVADVLKLAWSGVAPARLQRRP